jgi:7,8-dihydropterin-6-yl-methyl-4-(beta-D-ribofuranosyl)aminobenzene 5'-phosphate synthase
MKLATLMENTSRSTEYRCAHGLSLYLETEKARVLFDMGPDRMFLDNAKKLGIDPGAVDLAVLSHGHYDHGGGLRAFLECNHRAKVYLHRGVFGDYYALRSGGAAEYIGLDPTLQEFADRFVVTEGVTALSGQLTLFDGVPDRFGGMAASAKLQERTPDGFRPDDFSHEQNLLITEGGRAVVIAGCAHRGIVNIRERAAGILGREPDVMIGGFHLFELPAGDAESDRLIDRTGRALLTGRTVYYTGHCTGEYACARLETILGPRLHRLSAGAVFEI